MLALADGIDPEKGLQKPVRRALEKTDDEVERLEKEMKRPDQHHGGAQRPANCDRLGHEFTDDDVKEREGGIGNDQRDPIDSYFRHAGLREYRRYQRFHEGLTEETEGEGRECDPELVRGKIAVEVLHHMDGAFDIGAGFLSVGFKLAGPHLHDREFRCDEERVQQQEKRDSQEIKNGLPQTGEIMNHRGAGDEGKNGKGVYHRNSEFLVNPLVAFLEYGETRLLGVRNR